MGTQEKQPLPPRPANERDDVHVQVNRCPYCHTDVEATARDALACQGCLARHHAACWREAGACAACGGSEALVPARKRGLATLAAFALLVLGVLAALLGRPTPAEPPSLTADAPPPAREFAPAGTVELAPVQWTTVPVRGLERLELGVGVVDATPATAFQLHDSAGEIVEFDLSAGEEQVVTLLGHDYRVRYVRTLSTALGARAVVWITPLG